MDKPEGKPVKFTAKIQAPPLSLNREDAVEYLGSIKLFTDMEEAGWIRPVIQRTRFVVFDRAAIEAAWDRVLKGEYPGS